MLDGLLLMKRVTHHKGVWMLRLGGDGMACSRCRSRVEGVRLCVCGLLACHVMPDTRQEVG